MGAGAPYRRMHLYGALSIEDVKPNRWSPRVLWNIRRLFELGIVGCMAGTPEIEAGGSCVQDQPGLLSKAC